MSFSARTVLGDEAVRLGMANEQKTKMLWMLSDKRASQIAQFLKHRFLLLRIYNVAQSGLSMDDALKEEF